MTYGRQDAQFSYDNEYLMEGDYRTWFYRGLQESELAYLRQPPRMPEIKTKSKPTVLNGWFNEQRVWVEKAACKDADPVIFFKKGHSSKMEYLKPNAEWRKFCPQCPVREACLQAARDSESVGVWGGVFRHVPKNSRKIEEITG
jgi:hypothetical protein